MKKALILGVSAVQLDAIKMLQHLGVQVHACAKENDGPGAAFADVFIQIDFTDYGAMKEYIVGKNIDVVYSVGSDLAMPISTKLSEEFHMPHFVSSRTARICNNKNLLRQELGMGFVGNAYYQVIDQADNEINLPYPLIMKPVDSQGQRGVRLIRSKAEILKYFDETVRYSRSDLVILEQYISGPELSVNGYVVDGDILFLFFSDRDTWPKYTGLIHKHHIPSRYENPELNNKIRGLMIRACEKLEIKNGPVYAQVKLQENNPYIIEITPRLDGCHMWKLIRYSTGVNLLEMSFNHLLFTKKPNINLSGLINVSSYTLEFLCQKPHTPAQYKTVLDDRVLEYFNYYKQGEIIRPINGVYEKIAYQIYKEE